MAAVPHSAPIAPSDGELGLASWEPGDLAGVVLPAWDEFLELAAELDLDGPTRLDGLDRAGRLRAPRVVAGQPVLPPDARRGRARRRRPSTGRTTGPRPSTRTPTTRPCSRPAAGRRGPTYWPRCTSPGPRSLRSSAPTRRRPSGGRPVRSVLGPLPLSTLVGAGAYELAVHALDLAPAGARRAVRDAALGRGGRPRRHDRRARRPLRASRPVPAACRPEGGWAFAAGARCLDHAGAARRAAGVARRGGSRRRPAGRLGRTPGGAADAGAPRPAAAPRRRACWRWPPSSRRCPGCPAARRCARAVRNVRGLSRLVRRLPGVPG